MVYTRASRPTQTSNPLILILYNVRLTQRAHKKFLVFQKWRRRRIQLRVNASHLFSIQEAYSPQTLPCVSALQDSVRCLPSSRMGRDQVRLRPSLNPPWTEKTFMWSRKRTFPGYEVDPPSPWVLPHQQKLIELAQTNCWPIRKWVVRCLTGYIWREESSWSGVHQRWQSSHTEKQEGSHPVNWCSWFPSHPHVVWNWSRKTSQEVWGTLIKKLRLRKHQCMSCQTRWHLHNSNRRILEPFTIWFSENIFSLHEAKWSAKKNSKESAEIKDSK